jgi:hypothetical protein
MSHNYSIEILKQFLNILQGSQVGVQMGENCNEVYRKDAWL